MAEMHIESINAVALAVHDMSRSVRFYTALGFSVRYGGERAAFTSLHAGSCYLNLIAARRSPLVMVGAGAFTYPRRRIPSPRPGAGAGTDNRAWGCPGGERYFHISDPDGHELSFARRLERP